MEQEKVRIYHSPPHPLCKEPTLYKLVGVVGMVGVVWDGAGKVSRRSGEGTEEAGGKS